MQEEVGRGSHSGAAETPTFFLADAFAGEQRGVEIAGALQKRKVRGGRNNHGEKAALRPERGAWTRFIEQDSQEMVTKNQRETKKSSSKGTSELAGVFVGFFQPRNNEITLTRLKSRES